MTRFCKKMLLPLLLVVFAFCSCTNEEAGKLIPKDAAFVVRFDVNKMLTSVDKDEVDVEALKAKIQKALKYEKASDAEKALIENVLDDPSVLGVDVMEPMYYFLSKDYDKNDGVLIGSVSDADNIEKFVASVKEADPESQIEVKEYNDLKYVAFGKGSLMLYNSDWFVFSEHNWRNESLQEDAEKLALLFDLSENMSLHGSKAFEKLCKEDGVFQFLGFGAGFSEMGNYAKKKELSSLLPPEVHVSDFAFLSNFALDKGVTSISGELICLTSEAEDYIDDLPSGKIEGELKDYISNDAIFYTMGNLDGDEVYERIKSVKNFESLLKSDPMIESMVKNIYSAFDGDCAIVFENYESEQYLPRFAVFAETQHDDWLDFAKQLAVMNLVKKTGEKSYLFENNSRTFGGQIALGSKDDLAYVVGDPNQASLKKADEAVKEVGEGLYGYGRLNIQKLLSIPSIMASVRGAENSVFATDKFLNMLDFLEIKMESQTKGRVSLVMKDSDMTLTTALLKSFK